MANRPPMYPPMSQYNNSNHHPPPPPQQQYQNAQPQYQNTQPQYQNTQQEYQNAQPQYQTQQPQYPQQQYQHNQHPQYNRYVNHNSVVHNDFNKIWGVESVDLIKSKNVLPPTKIQPPAVKLHEDYLDNVNCSSDIFRCTLTKVPDNNSLLQKSRLPLGIFIHPFKDLNQLPVIQCNNIVRCRSCRTYINPFVYFIDSKRWKCNLCYKVNELPDDFNYDPQTNCYGAPARRPEVRTSTIEYIAPSEYMLRPPQPAVYLFVFDVTRTGAECDYLTHACKVIAEELSQLPGDKRTQVGFLAVDSAVHFFALPDKMSQPHQMTLLDIDDVFIPCPDSLLVNLKEKEELVKETLASLPRLFKDTQDVDCALGAALQVAFKLMSPTGGRITVFQTSLPNIGPGALKQRNISQTNYSKEVPHLNPATDFYKRLALDCSGQQIAVDLVVLNRQYSDMSTVTGISKFSGGCIYYLPLAQLSKPENIQTFQNMLRRYLRRKIGFEAVMRIRCTRGLNIHTFYGNFFVRSTDLLSLPNINPDAGFGMQISIEESLSDVQNICFQAALLYTSTKGERRIRVHTLCLPTSNNLLDIFYSADQQCIINLLAKMAVDKSVESSLSDAREALINAVTDILTSYKACQSFSGQGLLIPNNLKLMPLYVLALLKSKAFKSGCNSSLDERVYRMCQFKTLPLSLLMQVVYPDLYNITEFISKVSQQPGDESAKVQPGKIHLTSENLDSRGAYLLDAGDKMFFLIRKNIDPQFCTNVLNVANYSLIPHELHALPELATLESKRLNDFVRDLQEEKPYNVTFQIIREDHHMFPRFAEHLIEDHSETGLSYYEFLQHLKAQVK